MAVALHENFTYVGGEFGNDAGHRDNLVIAKDLLEEFEEKTGLAPTGEVVEFKGRELEGLEVQHPFLPRLSKVILGQFVTTETGREWCTSRRARGRRLRGGPRVRPGGDLAGR